MRLKTCTNSHAPTRDAANRSVTASRAVSRRSRIGE